MYACLLCLAVANCYSLGWTLTLMLCSESSRLKIFDQFYRKPFIIFFFTLVSIYSSKPKWQLKQGKDDPLTCSRLRRSAFFISTFIINCILVSWFFRTCSFPGNRERQNWKSSVHLWLTVYITSKQIQTNVPGKKVLLR